jgi:hypothetical protein
VRTHGDVGALAGRDLLDEVILDGVDALADDLDLDAGLLGVGLGRALQRVDALGVDPDGEGAALGRAVVAALAVAARAAREAERRDDGDSAGREEALGVHPHWCVPFSVCVRPAPSPGVGRCPFPFWEPRTVLERPFFRMDVPADVNASGFRYTLSGSSSQLGVT